MTDAGDLIVHYHRPLLDYDGWELWAWNARDLTSVAVPPGEPDDFGLVFRFGIDRLGPKVGILPRLGHWVDKDPPERFWSSAEPAEIWILSGIRGYYRSRPDTRPFVVGAWIEDMATLSVRLSRPLPAGELEPDIFYLRMPAGEPSLSVVQVRPGRGSEAGTAAGLLEVEVTVAPAIDLEKLDVWKTEIGLAGFRAAPLRPGRILDGPEWTSDAEMGAVCTPASTRFRIFAPTASGVTVNLYDRPAGGPPVRHAMSRGNRGVWELILPGDHAGLYYTLSAHGRDPGLDPDRELIDPCSRCNTAHDGRSLLFRDTTPVTDRPSFPPSEAVICELHIRDFTISPDSGVSQRGKYLGLTEEGTHLPGDPAVRTGLDHLIEMGFNTVQIMPFQDFANVESAETYDWGYMPVHFNAPDGWFATARDGAARVAEAKRMIDVLHRKGIRVVMDVVYNHTAERPPERIWSFEGLVPGYYYRLRRDGSLWDGSGTGNEFRTEAPMARKFLIDSLKYWVTEYKVDGFRFDLMGLIDSETLTQAVRELKSMDPGLLIYGEPWAAGPTPVAVSGKGTQRGKGYAVFNDDFRDAVKGAVFDRSGGFVQEGLHAWKIRRGLRGSIDDFALDPLESVNYVECHDNHTLWDRIQLTTADQTGLGETDRIRMDLLAGGLVLLAQGVPFLQAGQEMLRTKQGLPNTYDQPDRVNQIVWSWKRDRAAVVAFHRELIAIRRNHPLFRLAAANQVRSQFHWLDEDLGLQVPAPAVGFRLSGSADDAWREAVVVFHPGPVEIEVPLPPGEWLVHVQGERASAVQPLSPEPVSGSIRLAGRSVLVLAGTRSSG